jgi:hypothetical protein
MYHVYTQVQALFLCLQWQRDDTQIVTIYTANHAELNALRATLSSPSRITTTTITTTNNIALAVSEQSQSR